MTGRSPQCSSLTGPGDESPAAGRVIVYMPRWVALLVHKPTKSAKRSKSHLMVVLP